ncbi:pentapeptide repeat-containing protein [Muricauda sp. SCSIO 64092]|uniref:pentapeptide repeat-containing protein n=1 Tax=Allomuricauda sp. SCSIO 64092 TaxID=2908842 RepID=UPI001FF5FEA1|nr:pentapeptide repeat-containing protein [Muricauda sp. SCSIO 64092]UOY05008.1 pentapeptide repeat-containing protein [Muricauda sp. SCSIO 64092]
MKRIIPNNPSLENKIGAACVDSADHILQKIRDKKSSDSYESYFSIKAEDNIYRNIEIYKKESIEFTIITLNTLLCFFFYEKPRSYQFAQKHNTDDLKKFFDHIKIETGYENDRTAFHRFIADLELIKEHLTPLFNDFSFEITENFEFSVVSKGRLLESKGEDIQQTAKNKSEIIHDVEKPTNTAVKVKLDKIATSSEESAVKKRNKSIKDKTGKVVQNNLSILREGKKIAFIIILFVSIGVSLTFLVIKSNKQNIERKKVERENKIIENAKIIKASRIPQLVSLYESINRELNEDYKKDDIRNLSPELIGRIISLSNIMEPYIYFKDNKIISKALSPERGELFYTLFKSDLETETFYKIITGSNFTYSDLSGKNLSELNLLKGLYGIEGHYNNEVQILITPLPMINFEQSDFSDAIFDDASLYGNFNNCNFSNIKAKYLLAQWSNFSHSNFQESILESSRFENCELNYSNFKNSNLNAGYSDHDFGFFNCDLRGVTFDKSIISGGRNPFIFENCFFSSLGTFYQYELDNNWARTLSIKAFPYIDSEDNYAPLNSYEIVKVREEYDQPIRKPKLRDTSYYKHTRFINGTSKENYNILLNENFKILNPEDYNEKELWLKIKSVTYFGDGKEKLYFYFVRTNDNIDRSFKAFRRFARFFGYGTSKEDTLYVRSSYNKLQSEYAGLIYNHVLNRDSLRDGIASFKNCSFSNMEFKNSSMELVSFADSDFFKNTEHIENVFSNVRLHKNNFKINSGIFKFTKTTSYDSLYISNTFPLLVYKKNKDSLVDKAYFKRLYGDNSYKAKSYMNILESDRSAILDWIRFDEENYILDNQYQSPNDYLLRRNNHKSNYLKKPNID